MKNSSIISTSICLQIIPLRLATLKEIYSLVARNSHTAPTFLIASLALFSATSDASEVAAPQPQVPPLLAAFGFLPPKFKNVQYGGAFTPSAKDDTSLFFNRLNFQIPISINESDSLAFFGTSSLLRTEQPPLLTPSSVLVPKNLWKMEAGSTASRTLPSHSIVGARLTAGSASDHPFSRFSVMTFAMSLFYSWENEDHDRWILTLSTSNNNSIVNYFPIPGFAYVLLRKDYQAVLGIPFSAFYWTPFPLTQFSLTAVATNIYSEVAYGVPYILQGFFGFRWNQQIYLRADRTDPHSRLYYDEKLLPIGVRLSILKFLSQELSAGWSFDKSYYEGSHFFGKSTGKAPLPSSLYGQWLTTIRF